MTLYALWLTAPDGAVFQVLHDVETLNETERRRKLCEPMPIKAEHEGLPLDEIRKHYLIPILHALDDRDDKLKGNW